MKLARLTDSRFHVAIQKLSQQQMPLRVAFKLRGIQMKLDQELAKYEEIRQAALHKFGKRDAEGELVTKPDGSVDFEPEQLKAFAAELNDLGHTEIEVGTVQIDELGDKVQLSVNELSLLDGIIVE